MVHSRPCDQGARAVRALASVHNVIHDRHSGSTYE